MKAYILLDRSGSMQTNWVETIGSLNAYVEGLAGEKATKKTEITLAAFDSQEPYTVLRASVPVSSWKKLSIDEVAPRGGTPLYDSIGKLIDAVRSDAPKKATIVIITDGSENGSREIKKEAAKAMLDDMRAKNFDVVFIGADFDAFAQSAGLGTMAGQTINMSSGNYGAAMSNLAMRTAAYTSTGTVAAFSAEERKRASGGK